jgi:hypothetical protein
VKTRTAAFVGVGLLVALVLAAVVSFYASSSPDGLERVADDTGFNASEEDHALAESPLADYGTSGVDDARLSGGLAGVVGVATTFAIAGGIFYLVKRRGAGP